jgi:Tfp pilus assembly protein PilF
MHKDDPKGISASIDYISSVYIDNDIDCEIRRWEGAGWDETDSESITENQFREAVELSPENARDRLNLGVFLGLHGSHPTHFEEGYQHCIEAINLQPTWELPWIETANIILHIGDAARALKLLNDSAVYIKRPSIRLIYTRAFGKMINNEFGEAMELFEKAIQMKPDFAPAFENAAFCAFRSGDKIKGNRYAKSARRLGISTTFDLYDVGKTKEKPGRNPFEPLCESVMCPDKTCPERTSTEQVRQEFLERNNQRNPR